jgi:hypothetical protein
MSAYCSEAAMSEIEIWHHFFEPGETISQGGILAALARLGVRTHPLDPAAKGPGVFRPG